MNSLFSRFSPFLFLFSSTKITLTSDSFNSRFWRCINFYVCMYVCVCVCVCSWVVFTSTCWTYTKWWVKTCRVPSRLAVRTWRSSRWSRAWEPSRRKRWSSLRAGSAAAVTHRLYVWASINSQVVFLVTGGQCGLLDSRCSGQYVQWT